MHLGKWIETIARSVTVDLLKRAPGRRRIVRPAAFHALVDRLEQRLVMSAPPTVLSINRTATPITSASTVGYTIKFSEAVTGVAASDFKVITDGTAAFTAPVSVSGTSDTYTVNVNGVHGNGNLTLELVDNDTIIDSASNPLGGTGAGNGSFIGQSYSILQAFPAVQSINRTSPPGTTAGDGSVTYTVTFSKAVTGVDPTDFQVVTTGGVAASNPVTVSGSGAVYMVTINGITGTGTLGLNLVDDGTIRDLAGNPLQSNSTTAGSFKPAMVFGPGPQPKAIVVADMNGDGIPDLIESNPLGETIGVMLGNGDGTFKAPVTISTGTNSPYALAVADMNGDGNLDVIVANPHQNSIGILLGNGDGTLKAETTFAVGNFPISVATADFNGDGKLDVVAVNSQSSPGSVSVLLGNGDGTLQAQRTSAVGTSPRSVSISDLNGDGTPDLVVANYGAGISVLLGNGNGTFLPQHTFSAGSGPYSVTTADVNGDGIPDVITANTTYGQLQVLLGNGDGSFRSPIVIGTNGFPKSVIVTDVNGDGLPDLVVANPDAIAGGGDVGVLLGNGNGTFKTEQPNNNYSYPSVVAAADLNGDGRPDIVSNGGRNTTATVLLGNGVGNLTGQTYVISAIADIINGTPGNDDITLIQDPSTPSIDWTMGSASGSFAINDPNGLTVNGNGGNDTITLLYANGNPLPNSMHLNSGTGNFTVFGLQGTAPLAGTTLDIARSTVYINYAGSSSPLSLIQGYIQNGYNGGTWTGTNAAGVITSAAAAANHTGGLNTTGIGYADSADGLGINTVPNTVELTYTLYADANLDHQVNSADLQALLASFNTPGSWDQGDFNYDAVVNSADLQALLATFNTQLGNQAAPAASTVFGASNTGSPPNTPTSAAATTIPQTATTSQTPPTTTTVTAVAATAPVTKHSKPHQKIRHHRH
jgi:hypothetical protein